MDSWSQRGETRTVQVCQAFECEGFLCSDARPACQGNPGLDVAHGRVAIILFSNMHSDEL